MRAKLLTKRLYEDAKLPEVAHPGEDAGYDVFAYIKPTDTMFLVEPFLNNTERWMLRKHGTDEILAVSSDRQVIEERAAELQLNHEGITLKPGEQKMIPTGLAVSMENRVFYVQDEKGKQQPMSVQISLIAKQPSGVANKLKLDVKAGVIDAGYRNEINILLYNYGTQSQTIKHQQKIGQLVPILTLGGEVVEVEELPASSRGLNGWGSGHKEAPVAKEEPKTEVKAETKAEVKAETKTADAEAK